MNAYRPMTRQERTSKFCEKVEKEWKDTYLDFIKDYFAKPGFNWFNLTSNPNIDPQYIFDHPELPWDISRVIRRPDVTIETIISKYGLSQDILYYLMARDDMTMEYMESHPEYPWQYSYIHSLKSLSIDFIKQHETEADFWNYLQFHPNYTLREFLINFPDRVFEPDLTYRTGMTVEEALSIDSNILEVLAKTTRIETNICELVSANPDLKWDWVDISLNPHLTVPFMRKHQKQIKWNFLTNVIPKSVIRSNPRLPWDYSMYCYRNDLSRSELFEHMSSYNSFSFGSNSLIRFNDYKNTTLINWDINSVSENRFDAEKEAFYVRKYNEYLVTYRIQQYYSLVVSSPEYAICRKRVSADYDAEFTEDGVLRPSTKLANN